MQESSASSCRFETERLRVGEWHAIAQGHGLDLGAAISGILTDASTEALPAQWRGDYTIPRAQSWMSDRDGESPTLLVVDRTTGAPLGFVILFESPAGEESGIDLRIGYVFDATVWGKGLASELVAGLVAWADSQPSVHTLTGGVAASNPASARVLAKNGFRPVAGTEVGEAIYRRTTPTGTADRFPR